MSSITVQGKTYKLGTPGAPLSLDNIAPKELPRGWKEVDTRDWCSEREYGRGYLSTYGLYVLMTAHLQERKRWLHLSISYRSGRLPGWQEMCDVKDIFCGKEATAYQIHPPESKHVSIHPNCLHLWCCLDGSVTPDFTGGGESI